MEAEPERCTCAECRELDALPDRLQGIPGTWQMKLFAEHKDTNEVKRTGRTNQH